MASPTACRTGSAAPALLALLLLAACGTAGASTTAVATKEAAINGTGYCMVPPAFDVQETSTQMFLDIAGARHGQPQASFGTCGARRCDCAPASTRRRRARRASQPTRCCAASASALPVNGPRVLSPRLPRLCRASDAFPTPPWAAHSHHARLPFRGHRFQGYRTAYGDRRDHCWYVRAVLGGGAASALPCACLRLAMCCFASERAHAAAASVPGIKARCRAPWTQACC
jgi:hypothetical protein